MQTLSFEIEGIAPFIMHNGRTANPLDPWAKAIKELTGIRKKTDETHQQISDLEFLAGLYTVPTIFPGNIPANARVVVPDFHIEASLLRGARMIKSGKQFQSGCFVNQTELLDFPHKELGPTELIKRDEYRLVAAVNVGGKKVIRTRPCFQNWKLRFTVKFNPEIILPAEVCQSVDLAGQQCGMGSWRPKHGRFTFKQM